MKPEEWALVTSTESVPKQENTSDCGTFICMFGYFISQDASLHFSQANVTSFWKRMEYYAETCLYRGSAANANKGAVPGSIPGLGFHSLRYHNISKFWRNTSQRNIRD